MTDARRTIEVQVTNNTNVDLSVRAAVTNGASSLWIHGEQADSGQVVKQWESVTWGVFTNSEADAASATVSIGGPGNSAIDINLNALPDGTGSVVANSNDEIQATATQIDGTDNHAIWRVVLSLLR